MLSLDRHAQGKLAELEGRELRRVLAPTARLGGARVLRGGRELISFACNDYLDLAHHPRVKAAACEAVDRHGAGAGASRLVTGDAPETGALEAALARRAGSQAALAFGSGYLANLGVLPALAGPGDLVLVDALAHSCIWAGARLSGARVERFAHNDLADLERRLAAGRGDARHALIATESVFSMDGDPAPVPDILKLAERRDAWALVDDAHGLGVLEPASGARPPLQVGTLSKALGSTGGYVCASRAVVDLLTSRARPFVYTTGLAPAAAAAALAALEVLEAEPERGARARASARRLAGRLGLPEPAAAIVPLVVGDPREALRLAAGLEAQGFLAPAIRPPTVAPGTARLRFALSAAHTPAQVDAVADAVLALVARRAA
ncbi:MAG: 8-amino-7-oxononanoate synthase [Caulobacteraceae bacterium]|nr:8-amino-7-oxononanoate synthase [Caulobacter sp.]